MLKCVSGTWYSHLVPYHSSHIDRLSDPHPYHDRGSRRASALLAARTSSHEPSRCQSIILVILHDARSKPPARARRNWSAQWLKRTSAQTLSATTRWLSPHVDVTSNIDSRKTLARYTKPVPTAEAICREVRRKEFQGWFQSRNVKARNKHSYKALLVLVHLRADRMLSPLCRVDRHVQLGPAHISTAH